MTDRGPLSVGIWLELAPDTSLHGEGIMRTLMAVVRELSGRDDARVVVALAAWNVAAFRELLDDWDVPAERVRIIASRAREPFVLSYRRRRKRKRTRRGIIGRLVRWAASWPWLRLSFGRMLGTSSPILAGLMALAGAAALVLAAPVLLVLAAVAVGRRLVRHAARQCAGPYAWLRDAIAESEFIRLADRANEHANVDVWFVTHPGSAHAARLQAPLVLAVPDLVYVEFPTLFDRTWADGIDERARRLAVRAARFITYSRRVAQLHVVEHLGVPPDRVRVVPHAPFDASASLAAPGISRLDRAVQLAGFPCGEADYLFVTSQIRPTKNYLNLFRAFERLRRERRRDVKLVITGDLSRPENKSLLRYIREAGLERDIVSVPRLPSREHAAFMHFAALTVVPTLFEGGFPFPFSESISVGTPVVMSDIPIVREVIPAPLRELMLFDPYDVGAMAGRIAEALDIRDDLLARQQQLRLGLSERTWPRVAGEYLDVFREAAGQPIEPLDIA